MYEILILVFPCRHNFDQRYGDEMIMMMPRLYDIVIIFSIDGISNQFKGRRATMMTETLGEACDL